MPRDTVRRPDVLLAAGAVRGSSLLNVGVAGRPEGVVGVADTIGRKTGEAGAVGVTPACGHARAFAAAPRQIED